MRTHKPQTNNNIPAGSAFLSREHATPKTGAIHPAFIEHTVQPLSFTPVSDLLEVPDTFDDLLGLLEDGGLYTVRVQPIELGALGNEQDTVRCKQRKRLALIALKHSSRESNRVQNQRLQPPTCAEAYAKYAARTSSVRRLKILVTPSRWAALARDIFGSWHISPTSARKLRIMQS